MNDELIETVVVITDSKGIELLVVSINRLVFKDLDEAELLNEILPDLESVVDGEITIDVFQKKRTNLH